MDTSIITRSEATHRLKIISSKVNNAISAIRDGNWTEGYNSALEAGEFLEALFPHLEEASEAPASPVVTRHSLRNVRISADEAFERIGGMGYRGSSHESKPVGSLQYGVPPNTPPPPIKINTAPPRPVIITPPPPIAIVTPPPIPKRVFVPPPPVEWKPEVVVPGEYEYNMPWRSEMDGKAFDQLPEERQMAIMAEFWKTRGPVKFNV